VDYETVIGRSGQLRNEGDSIVKINGSTSIDVHDQDDRNCGACWAKRAVAAQPSFWSVLQYGLRLISELNVRYVCLLFDQMLVEYSSEREPIVSRCPQCKNAFGCAGQAAVFDVTHEYPTNVVVPSASVAPGHSVVPLRPTPTRGTFAPPPAVYVPVRGAKRGD